MNASIVILFSLLYLLLLFAIAIYANNQNKIGKSIVNNPYVYSLSLAVYCTVWTFYGSVGRAAESGIGFAAVYLGPTILAPVWYMVMRKIILVSKQQRITSIADFISSRYGKSTFLGALTTIILVFGIIPYISIQLKAIGFSFEIITNDANSIPSFWDSSTFYRDKVNYFTILLAIFTILFGTRSLDPNERHEGLIAAIAFESIVKLIAFTAIGIFVVFVAFDGLPDLFQKGSQLASVNKFYTVNLTPGFGANWFWVMILSAFAAMFLPRQFHVAVVENHQVSFVRQASWMFPLYLFLISVFVIPIAIAGKLSLGENVEADTFVLNLPLHFHQDWLALLVYIGGFSAAASMVVVSVISLSIMISNNLLMPMLLKTRTAQIDGFAILSERLLYLRRLVIIVILFLAYGFYKTVSKDFPLVSIGLISFAAILQLAPVVIGGLYWSSATKKGAMAGLIAGFLVWFFALPLPTLAMSGLLDQSFISDGYFGWSMLKPHALFGLDYVDPIANACIWSMVFNVGFYVFVSLMTKPDVSELTQGDIFVNIEKYSFIPEHELLRKEATVVALKSLLIRYLGENKTETLLMNFSGPVSTGKDDQASQEFINYIEKILTGAFGSASAKLLISTDIKQKNVSLHQLNELLNQTKEILEYSTALESKTLALEQASAELATVNEQLKELDILKAEFISTVTHELRTPITTIRSFAQIIQKKGDQLTTEKQQEFIHIILQECDRIKRLINQVLDVEKLTNSSQDHFETTSVQNIIDVAIQRLTPWMNEKDITFELENNHTGALIHFQEDKVLQILLNILTNAIKFCDSTNGKIKILVEKVGTAQNFMIEIHNNGKAIPVSFQKIMFEKFTQQKDGNVAKPEGSGLGLFITKKLVEQANGQISVRSVDDEGTSFRMVFPDLA